MRRTSTLVWLTLIFVPGLVATDPSPVRLVCDVDGRSLPLASVQGSQLLLLDGDKFTPAPENGAWRFEGDFRAAAHAFRWRPDYEIERWHGPDLRAKPETPFTARVILLSENTVNLTAEARASLPAQDWPDPISPDTACIFVWFVPGAQTMVAVQAASHADERAAFRLEAEFALTAEEAAKGHAAIALWQKGSLLAPTPEFASSATQDAFNAVVLDDVPALKSALAAGARPDVAGHSGASLIHIAAETGANASLDLLLTTRPALVRATTKSGETPLHVAAAKGRIDAIRRLLAAKARPVAWDNGGGSPLLHAALRGHLDAARLLLETPGRLDDKAGGFEWSMDAALDRGDAQLATLLLESGADFKPDNLAEMVLLTQIRLGHTAMVQWLIEHGVRLHFEGPGEDVLLAAARIGDAGLIQILIDHHAAFDHRNAAGMTPLMMACDIASTEAVRRLLDTGASPNATSERGMTPLHFASIRNSTDVATMLLDQGADLAARNSSGFSALDVALASDSAGCVELLVSRGARLNLALPQTAELIGAAMRLDAAELISRAIADGWMPNSTLTGGWPQVHVASMFEARRVLDVLLRAGANADAPPPSPIVPATELDGQLLALEPRPPDDPRNPFVKYPAMILQVDALIDAEGRPRFLRVRQPADPFLRAAALDAVAASRFVRPVKNGQPVATQVTHAVTFPSSRDRAFAEGRSDVRPKVIKRGVPVYPPNEKAAGRRGMVTVGLIVNREGRVERLYIVDSEGPAFSLAALAAIEQWEFTPGMMNGIPVDTKMHQPAYFDTSR